ncbi:MAG: hypothetical protein RLO50_02015 [Azospirillaceae bacterium]
MSARQDDTFFIGWATAPKSTRRFMLALAGGLVLLFGFSAYVIASTQNDPGSGAFRFDWGRQTVTGMISAAPYPMLHVVESERFPAGHVLLLSGNGKRGVQDRAETLDGQLVEISGVALNRGDLDMVQLLNGENGLRAVDGPTVALPEDQDLGHWRLTGEICDGKCYSGAMRPGDGIAHRACAGVCLIGGVPPVFVTTAPIEGEEFLVLGGSDGGPLPDDALAHVGILVEIDGQVFRRGDVLVFRVSTDSIRIAGEE